MSALRAIAAAVFTSLAAQTANCQEKVIYQTLTDNDLAPIIKFMGSYDEVARNYFSQVGQYRDKLQATTAVFEPSGAPIARAMRNRNGYSIVIPVGVFHLSMNIANIFQLRGLMESDRDRSLTCIRSYKSYLSTYYGMKDTRLFQKTKPIDIERFADANCGFKRQDRPEVNEINNFNLFLSSGLFLIMIHEYGHILLGHLERPPSKKQELDADSFAAFHLFNFHVKELAPIYFFAMYAFGYLGTPISAFSGSAAPSAPERLDAIVAGARGYAKLTNDAALQTKIDNEEESIIEEFGKMFK